LGRSPAVCEALGPLGKTTGPLTLGSETIVATFYTTVYTTYEFVKGRLGLPMLLDILSEQIEDGAATEDEQEEDIQRYIEAEIVKIDALIDSACIKQIEVPVLSTNKSFGILVEIAESLILRKVATHTQHDDIPTKIENAYIAAMRTLGQIMRGELVLARDGQTGPSDDGDSISVSDPETSPFQTDMEDAW